MSSPSFSLSGLSTVYRDAIAHQEQTLAFEVAIGKGAFVFLMFFSPDDIESQDKLFLFLRNTSVMLDFKLYGNHWKGGTKVYVDPYRERSIRAELQLAGGGQPFELGRFFEQLNAGIPSSLPMRESLGKLREVWPSVQTDLRDVIDEAQKTVLIGIRKLEPPRKPQEKTLRKLFLFVDGPPRAKEDFIRALKQINYTLAWSTEARRSRTFAEVVSSLQNAHLKQPT